MPGVGAGIREKRKLAGVRSSGKARCYTRTRRFAGGLIEQGSMPQASLVPLSPAYSLTTTRRKPLVCGWVRWWVVHS